MGCQFEILAKSAKRGLPLSHGMNNLFNLENYDGSAQSPAIDLTEEIDDDWEEIPQGDFHDDHDFSENFSLGEQDWETGHDFDAEAVVEQSNFDSAMTSDTVETKEWNNMVAGGIRTI